MHGAFPSFPRTSSWCGAHAEGQFYYLRKDLSIWDYSYFPVCSEFLWQKRSLKIANTDQTFTSVQYAVQKLNSLHAEE
jgi:hypothetical protein